MGNEPEHALPAEQHGCRQNHTDAVSRGEHHRRHEVERGIGKEEGVVALQGRDDWSEHRQRTDAIEQNGC